MIQIFVQLSDWFTDFCCKVQPVACEMSPVGACQLHAMAYVHASSNTLLCHHLNTEVIVVPTVLDLTSCPQTSVNTRQVQFRPACFTNTVEPETMLAETYNILWSMWRRRGSQWQSLPHRNGLCREVGAADESVGDGCVHWVAEDTLM